MSAKWSGIGFAASDQVMIIHADCLLHDLLPANCHRRTQPLTWLRASCRAVGPVSNSARHSSTAAAALSQSSSALVVASAANAEKCSLKRASNRLRDWGSLARGGILAQAKAVCCT
jgi:hypothetical protein